MYGSSATNNAYKNTAIGNHALQSNNTGDDNVAVGWKAGENINGGNHNVYLGFMATGSDASVSNEILIGAGAGYGVGYFVGAGTETVRIGRQSDYITCDFGENATWAHSSDRRIKKDIETSDLGLDFINDLRPVTFKKKAPSEYPPEFSSYSATQTERKNPDKKRYGFIAQEVKEAMDNAGHPDFTVWSEDKSGQQELGEIEFINPLVKAVQELSEKVEAQQKEIEELKNR